MKTAKVPVYGNIVLSF